MVTKQILDGCLACFNMTKFLSVDPLGVVYELKRHTDNQMDIELGALYVAMLSWGNREHIRKAAFQMLEMMRWHPSEYTLKDCRPISSCVNNCVYRTLNQQAFYEVRHNIRSAVLGYDSLEQYFDGKNIDDIVYEVSLWLRPANCGTYGKSACKRICMWLRWMIRSSEPDMGVWRSRNPSELYAVMDTHVVQFTRHMLAHRGASWQSMQELTSIFRQWHSLDPLRYDVALMTYVDSLG